MGLRGPKMVKPEKTPQEIAEDNKPTNEMGLFNTAEARGFPGTASS